MNGLDRRALLLALSGGAFSVACRTVGSGASSGVKSLSTAPVMRRRWIPGEKSEYKDKYIRAVSLLKANDSKYPGEMDEGLLKYADDPEFFLSWKGLVFIHFQSCHHGNWFLLPYHRMYVMFFEATCQEILNDPTFAVPYWDWTIDGSIPSEFYEVETLKVENRALKKGQFVNPAAVGKAKIDKLMATPDFKTIHSDRPPIPQPFNPFIGGGTGGIGAPPTVQKNEFETGPHDTVHNEVGGWMADPRRSPTDPIFWLHHGNIDRLWSRWLNLHPTSVVPFLTLSEAEKKAEPNRARSWGETIVYLDCYLPTPSVNWEFYEKLAFTTLFMGVQTANANEQADKKKQGADWKGSEQRKELAKQRLLKADRAQLKGSEAIGKISPQDMAGAAISLPALPGDSLPAVESNAGKDVLSNSTVIEEPLKPAEVMELTMLIGEHEFFRLPAPKLIGNASNRGALTKVAIRDMLMSDKLPFFFDTDAQLASPLISMSTILSNQTQVTQALHKTVTVKAKIVTEESRVFGNVSFVPSNAKKIIENRNENFARLTYFDLPIPEHRRMTSTKIAIFLVAEKEVPKFSGAFSKSLLSRPELVAQHGFFGAHNHSPTIDHSKLKSSFDVTQQIEALVKSDGLQNASVIIFAYNESDFSAQDIFKGSNIRLEIDLISVV